MKFPHFFHFVYDIKKFSCFHSRLAGNNSKHIQMHSGAISNWQNFELCGNSNYSRLSAVISSTSLSFLEACSPELLFSLWFSVDLVNQGPHMRFGSHKNMLQYSLTPAGRREDWGEDWGIPGEVLQAGESISTSPNRVSQTGLRTSWLGCRYLQGKIHSGFWKSTRESPVSNISFPG